MYILAIAAQTDGQNWFKILLDSAGKVTTSACASASLYILG